MVLAQFETLNWGVDCAHGNEGGGEEIPLGPVSLALAFILDSFLRLPPVSSPSTISVGPGPQL